MEKLLNKIYNDNEFINIIYDLLENETVKRYDNITQRLDKSIEKKKNIY